VIDFLTSPLSSAEAQRAWVELALLSVPAGALGAFVVLRRLAFATHALGVGAFPGTVIALGAGFSTFLGGLGAALVLAILLASLERRGELDVPAATGLLLAGALALGALLATDVFSLGARDADEVLFGPVLGAEPRELARAAAVAMLSAAAWLAFARGWLVVAFDRESAPAFGFAAEPLDIALLGMLAVAVVTAVDAVGALLVSSIFVVPAGTARLFCHRLPALAAASAGISLGVGTAGLWLAGHIDVPQGACVAAVAAGAFVVALASKVFSERRARGAAREALAHG
jgi:ABC-type Mn2+/Zn2+ transport system permease subunit